MNVSIVNRIPLVLQKSAKRSHANSGHHSHDSGNAVQAHADAENAHDTGKAVDKEA
jgi:hypothetical protein